MKKILVVDDEKDVETLFLQRFRKEIRSGEYEFVFAFSGEQALDILKTDLAHEAVLILSDINMPGMSGLELLNNIKVRFLTPPPVVLMISAYGDEKNQQEAKNLGADGFLTKPVDFTLLKDKLKSLP